MQTITVPTFMLEITDVAIVALREALAEAKAEADRWSDVAATRSDTIQDYYDEIETLRDKLDTANDKLFDRQPFDSAFPTHTLDGLDFIPAIKKLRDATNCGLKEGKEQVEKWVLTGDVKLKDGYIPRACLDQARKIIALA